MATDAAGLPKEVSAPKQLQLKALLFTACETRDARVEQTLERLRPPPTVSGYKAVRSKKQKMLRLLQHRSFMQRIGRVLGSDDACTRHAWDELSTSEQHRAAATEFVLFHELDHASIEEVRVVENFVQLLLDPSAAPLGMRLLRAVAKELYKYSSTEGLPTCWAW